jgi:hypothetical protein
MKLTKEQNHEMIRDKVSEWLDKGNRIKKVEMTVGDQVKLEKVKGSGWAKIAQENIGIKEVKSGS